MRFTTRFARKAIALTVVAAALTAMLVAPVAANATVTTISLSKYYQAKAASLYIGGKLPSKYRGTEVRVEIRKPGRAYWTPVRTVKVRSTGVWNMSYLPRIGGTFYIRARHKTGLSATKRLTVKKGPGVKSEVVLASTTSTRDSGLFERIGPQFLSDCPEYTLKALFVGSGTAIGYGGTGDADVLLTHSPAAEVDFMNGIVAKAPSEHRGKDRYKVMYNDYVLVGPSANPAGVAVDSSATVAFKAISDYATTPFYSRNDNSGTNAKEKEIWAVLGNPQLGTNSWYKASGTMGMAQALAAANDSANSGYTLADRGTWLNATALGTTKNLKVVNEGDALYKNQYSVITVTGTKNQEGGTEFSSWIRSSKIQNLIKSYGEYTYSGQVLFIPNAGSY